MSKHKDTPSIGASWASIIGIGLSIGVSLVTTTLFIGDVKADGKVTRLMAEDTRDKNRSLYTIIIGQNKLILGELSSIKEDVLIIKVKKEMENGTYQYRIHRFLRT